MSAFLTVFAGVLSAQAITLLLSPVLSRLYTPSDFGVYWAFAALASLLGVGAAGRYELAVGLPKDDEDAALLAAGALLLSGGCALFLPLLLYAGGHVASTGLPDTALGRLGAQAAWAGAAVALYGTYQVLNYWLNRKSLFASMTILKITQAVLAGVLALALSSYGATGWISAYLLGLLGACAWGWREARRNGLTFGGIALPRIRGALGRFRQFPMNALPAVMDAGGNWLPVLFVSAAFHSHFAGQFTMSRQILGAPLSLIAAAITPVLYQRLIARSQQGQSLVPYLSRYAIGLGGIGMLAAPVVIIWGGDLFAFVFGETWREAGVISGVLIFAYALRFVGSALSIVLVSLGAMRSLSAWQIASFAAIAVVCLIPHGSPEAFLRAYAATEVVLYAAYAAISFWHAFKHDRGLQEAMPGMSGF